jgi:hypothetical protein
MTDTRHLDTAISILRAPVAQKEREDLQAAYAQGLEALGFMRTKSYRGRFVFTSAAHPGVTYEVGHGNDVRRAVAGGESYPLPRRARKMILLSIPS